MKSSTNEERRVTRSSLEVQGSFEWLEAVWDEKQPYLDVPHVEDNLQMEMSHPVPVIGLFTSSPLRRFTSTDLIVCEEVYAEKRNDTEVLCMEIKKPPTRGAFPSHTFEDAFE